MFQCTDWFSDHRFRFLAWNWPEHQLFCCRFLISFILWRSMYNWREYVIHYSRDKRAGGIDIHCGATGPKYRWYAAEFIFALNPYFTVGRFVARFNGRHSFSRLFGSLSNDKHCLKTFYHSCMDSPTASIPSRSHSSTTLNGTGSTIGRASGRRRTGSNSFVPFITPPPVGYTISSSPPNSEPTSPNRTRTFNQLSYDDPPPYFTVVENEVIVWLILYSVCWHFTFLNLEIFFSSSLTYCEP